MGVAADRSGRPVHLLEKDVWVVWALDALFAAPFGNHLVFKRGTSLSKAYDVIARLSEDVDLTYDIRTIAPDLARPRDHSGPTQERVLPREGWWRCLHRLRGLGSGGLQLVPEGDRLALLADDYQRMVADGLLFSTPPPFRSLIALCLDIQNRAHAAVR